MKAITKMRAQQAQTLLPYWTENQAGIEWLRGWLVQFDLAKLSGIGWKTHRGDISQACWGNANPPPKRSRKFGWTLTCVLAPNFPNATTISMPPFYRSPDGTWAPAPSRVAVYGDDLPDWSDEIIEAYFMCLDVNDTAGQVWAEDNRTPAGMQIAGHGKPGGRRMLKVERHEPIADASEASVFVVGHLSYYWLRHTQQTPGLGGGRNTAAGLFGRSVLNRFRAERGA